MSRLMYTRKDDEDILRYILANASADASLGGNRLWKKLETENIIKGRTYQSLENRFRKTIIRNLQRYNLSSEERKWICNARRGIFNRSKSGEVGRSFLAKSKDQKEPNKEEQSAKKATEKDLSLVIDDSDTDTKSESEKEPNEVVDRLQSDSDADTE